MTKFATIQVPPRHSSCSTPPPAWRSSSRGRLRALARASAVVMIALTLAEGLGVLPTATAQTHSTPPSPHPSGSPAIIGDSLTFDAAGFLPGDLARGSAAGAGAARAAVVRPPCRDPSHHTVRGCGPGEQRLSHQYSNAAMLADVRRVNHLLSGQPCVRWTTVKVGGVTPYYSAAWSHYASQWNRVVQRHADGVVLDWNAAAQTHPEYFLARGLHMADSGRAAYARFLATGIGAPLEAA